MKRLERVLVADDDASVREVIVSILEQAGYEVMVASDGLEAVAKATAERPDLVLLDGLMPRIHGFFASKTIKQLEEPPKVIILTGVYTRLNYKWEALRQYGADEFLTKPFDKEELIASVKKQLATKSAREGVYRDADSTSISQLRAGEPHLANQGRIG